MLYLKINSIIFEIELCENSLKYESDKINPECATYETNKFKILNYKHIANNKITEDEFKMCLIYLYIQKIKEDLINDNVLNVIKNQYNIHKMDDFINKEIERNIYYFKSYERAFNFRFIYDKQYQLFTEGYSGIYKNWTPEGKLVLECYHINGKIEGKFIFNNKIFTFVNDVNIDNTYCSKDLILLDHFYHDYE